MKINTLYAAGLLLLSANAGAHALWVEPVDGEMHVCFGEYGENLREKTGGTLDKITDLEVIELPQSTTGQLGFTRQVDYLLLTKNAEALSDKQAVAIRAGKSKVRDSKDPKIGMVKPMQYARFAMSDTEPASTLALDIQPVAKNTFKLNFNGKPLAKTVVTVIAPNQWQRELKTNEAGEVTLNKPWKGLYVIEASHLEQLKGEFEGQKFDAVRHASTLSVRQE